MSENTRFVRTAAGAGITALAIWLAIAAAYFLWLAFWYSGIIGNLGEWQFFRVYFYYPVLTYILLVFLALLPVVIVLAVLRLLARRGKRDRDGQWILASVGNLHILFLGLGIAGLIGSAGALLLMLLHPSSGPTHDVKLGTASADKPAEGPTKLSGTIDYTRATRLKDDLFLFSREIYIAPMVTTASADEPIRYFVEVPPSGPTARKVPSVATGILSHEALPREIRQLYRNTGNTVTGDNYFLFASEQSFRWRWLVVAAEFAIFGILNLIFGLIQSRNRRRLESELEPVTYAASPTG